jgi:type IV secretory pathway TraG/TraD family ATPase VirD4
VSAALPPAAAREILLAGREPGRDWIVPAQPRARLSRAALAWLFGQTWGRLLFFSVASWIAIVLVLEVKLGNVMLAWPLLLLAAYGAIFCGGLLAILVGALSRAGGESRATAARDDTYGDARFAPLAAEFAERDAAAACLIYRPERAGSAVGYVAPNERDLRVARWSWDQLSRHVLVVGATGSGKTSTVFSHLMLSARVPWVYQDQKAELPLRDLFPQRPVWGLDTRGHRTRSAVWNPLDEVRGPEDVEVLAALLFPDRGDQNDWVIRGARLLFEGLLKHHRFPSLQAVAWLLEHKPMDELVASLPGGYASSVQDPRTRSYFHSTLLEVLKPWSTARIAAVTMEPSTVRLEDFIREGGYVLANEDKHLRQPVTLFWGMLLYRLRQRAADSSRLLLLMDEFGDAGRVPNMAQALALYRGKGVAIVAGVQSLGLMRAVYGEDEWTAVRDGFGSLLVLAANMPAELRREVTDQLGKWTLLHQHESSSWNSPSVSLGAHGANLSLGGLGGGRSTPTRHPVDLIPMDQWAVWGAARAAIVRSLQPTWWVPVAVPIEPAPLGPPTPEPAGDWRELERERVARLGATLGERLVPELSAAADERHKLLFS